MYATALVTSCASAERGAVNSPADAQQLIVAGSQPSTTGSNDHFTGRADVDPLSPASPGINASIAYVTFEPGARSAWHTHPGGQVLVVTAGAGLTQQWGGPVQKSTPATWCAALPASNIGMALRRRAR